jgi:hypothetical protein
MSLLPKGGVAMRIADEGLMSSMLKTDHSFAPRKVVPQMIENLPPARQISLEKVTSVNRKFPKFLLKLISH